MIPRYSLTYEGDLDECVKHITFAQNLLLHAAQTKQGVLRRQVNETVVIRIDVNTVGTSRIHIKATTDGMYMESGVLDIISIANCDYRKFLPAQLSFTQAMGSTTPADLLGKAMTTDTPDYFMSEGLIEGDSKAIGCDQSVRVPTVKACDTSPQYTAPYNAFCDSKGMLRRKECILKAPASLYTGKLKRYVQAVYGTKREDYSLFTPSIGADYAVIIGGTKLDFLLPTHGLYTTPDYRYFLLRVSTTSIVAKALIPSATGEAWRLKLVQHADEYTPGFIKKVESYILSTCEIAKESHTSNIGGKPIIGEPYAYGWHFTQNGHRADMVTGRDGDPNYSHWLYTYHFSIAITLTAESGTHGKPDHQVTFTALITEEESNKPWSPTDLGHFFSPEWGIGKMYVPTNPPPYIGGGVDLSHNAPVYCYYTESDDLQTVRAENTVVVAGSSFLRTNITGHGSIEANELRITQIDETNYTGTTTRRFTVNSSPVSSVTIRNTSTTTESGVWTPTGTSDWPTITYNQLTYPNSISTYGGLSTRDYETGWAIGQVATDIYAMHTPVASLPGPPYQTSFLVGVSARIATNVGTFSRTANNVGTHGRVVAIVPYGDASVCIFGSRKTRSRGARTTVSGYNTSAKLSCQGKYYQAACYPEISEIISITNVYGIRDFVNRYYDAVSGNDVSVPTVIEPPESITDVEFALADNLGNVATLITLNGVESSSYDGVFNIPIGVTNIGEFASQVTTGMLGSSYIYTPGVGKLRTDFPGHAAVGWA